jgi:hypothetical protein
VFAQFSTPDRIELLPRFPDLSPLRRTVMNPPLDPTFVLSNRIEAAFWTVIGLACLLAAFCPKTQPKRDALIAAVTFIAFGGSDVVESATGAWWRPWWLLLWKGACVATPLWLLLRYARRRRRRSV